MAVTKQWNGVVVSKSSPTIGLCWYTKGAGYCVPMLFDHPDPGSVISAGRPDDNRWVTTPKDGGDIPAGHGYYEHGIDGTKWPEHPPIPRLAAEDEVGVADTGPLTMGIILPDSNPTIALGWYTKGAGYCVPIMIDGPQRAMRVAEAVAKCHPFENSQVGWTPAFLHRVPAGHGYYEHANTSGGVDVGGLVGGLSVEVGMVVGIVAAAFLL